MQPTNTDLLSGRQLSLFYERKMSNKGSEVWFCQGLSTMKLIVYCVYQPLFIFFLVMELSKNEMSVGNCHIPCMINRQRLHTYALITSMQGTIMNIEHYNLRNIFARVRLVQTRHVTEHSLAKSGEHPSDIPQLSKSRVLQKKFEG